MAGRCGGTFLCKATTASGTEARWAGRGARPRRPRVGRPLAACSALASSRRSGRAGRDHRQRAPGAALAPRVRAAHGLVVLASARRIPSSAPQWRDLPGCEVNSGQAVVHAAPSPSRASWPGGSMRRGATSSSSARRIPSSAPLWRDLPGCVVKAARQSCTPLRRHPEPPGQGAACGGARRPPRPHAASHPARLNRREIAARAAASRSRAAEEGAAEGGIDGGEGAAGGRRRGAPWPAEAGAPAGRRALGSLGCVGAASIGWKAQKTRA